MLAWRPQCARAPANGASPENLTRRRRRRRRLSCQQLDGWLVLAGSAHCEPAARASLAPLVLGSLLGAGASFIGRLRNRRLDLHKLRATCPNLTLSLSLFVDRNLPPHDLHLRAPSHTWPTRAPERKMRAKRDHFPLAPKRRHSPPGFCAREPKNRAQPKP